MKFTFNSKDIGPESFVYRAVVIAVVAAVAAGLVWILWTLKDLIPAVFATILLAVGWRGAAQSLSKRFGLSIGVSLALVALGLAAVIALAFSLFGGDLLKQYDEIAIDIPAAIAMIEGSVEAHPWGEFVEKLIAGV
ncbi:MAG TPA: AI-2E family transporter, partial [Methylocystis sp.]|nr:AI-2E family transporter [Methylocystis sp.]